MKEFLSRAGVPFEERNVSANPAYVEELRARGYWGTPVTFAGDIEVEGFDRAALEDLVRRLGPAGPG